MVNTSRIDQEATLRRDAIEVRAGLVEYAGWLYSGQAQQAEVRRIRLAEEWNALADRLARTSQPAGKPLVMFETLFGRAGGRLAVPTKRALAAALNVLDDVIDTLPREAPVPARRQPASLDVITRLIIIMLMSWLIAALWVVRPVALAWLETYAASLYAGGSILLALAGTIGGGLLVHLLHQEGWHGAWKTYPWKSTAYLMLLTVSVVMGLAPGK